ncbi:hypothetical protein HG535_0G02250 [Zygotorulaspora mrakii]|uniref:Uncharacterized protein n=1 Tax=Zygotorulaspora mrakii TaxID=42260 RepID=A0A7H9B6N3_ZYGMR|nr:uncharacterized protein HG535_0G02250 [Zygotorulaspora mrakii]QLG74341.1 hypothetical protein HG535_0G02250 [Zygotorulaspora mrakii]
MKFRSIEEAAGYVNSQLVLKGFLKHELLLKLDGTIDDNRLVVNTIHRLLRSLDDKNAQILELHARQQLQDQASQKAQPEPVEKSPRAVRKLARVVKPTDKSPRTDSKLLSQRYKVKVNKLESTIEELRQQLQLERNRRHNGTSHASDLTWEINQDVTALSRNVHYTQVAKYEEEISSLLETRDEHQELARELAQFLETVNRYTYSSVIMGVRGLPPPARSPRLQQLSNDDLQELIADWYEIVAIAQNSQSPEP